MYKSQSHTPNYSAMEIYMMMGDLINGYMQLISTEELNQYKRSLIAKEIDRMIFLRHELSKTATIRFVVEESKRMDYDVNV